MAKLKPIQTSVALDFSSAATAQNISAVVSAGNRIISSLLYIKVGGTGIAGSFITIRDVSDNFRFVVPVENDVAGPLFNVGKLDEERPDQDGFFWTAAERIVCEASETFDDIVHITHKGVTQTV